jgi:two-component system KDP operon response regulator KdpE
MKVLITDTNREFIKEIKLLFSLCEPDWQVLVCYSAQQCLSALSHYPDLFIIAMELPDMSGYDLVGKIRDDSDIPIIAISNIKNESSLVKAFDCGANDYIVRPFNKGIFLARLRAIIRRFQWDMKIKGGEFFPKQEDSNFLDFHAFIGNNEK